MVSNGDKKVVEEAPAETTTSDSTGAPSDPSIGDLPSEGGAVDKTLPSIDEERRD